MTIIGKDIVRNIDMRGTIALAANNRVAIIISSTKEEEDGTNLPSYRALALDGTPCRITAPTKTAGTVRDFYRKSGCYFTSWLREHGIRTFTLGVSCTEAGAKAMAIMAAHNLNADPARGAL